MPGINETFPSRVMRSVRATLVHMMISYIYKNCWMCNVLEGIPFLMTFKHLNEKVKKTFKVFSKILSISHVPCVQDCNGNIENSIKFKINRFTATIFKLIIIFLHWLFIILKVVDANLFIALLLNLCRFYFGKNKVMALALGRTQEDEYKDNLHKLSNQLRGQSGLLFTNKSKKEVIR